MGNNLNKASLLTGLLAAFMAFTSCDNSQSPELPVPKPGKVYLAQAVNDPGKVSLTDTHKQDTVEYSANIGGVGSANTDILVQFGADSSLVSKYNAEHGTSYDMLPESNYVLTRKIDTIHAGVKHGTKIELIIKNEPQALEKDKEYLLPVTLKQVSGNLSINENLQNIYFIVVSHIIAPGVKPSGQGTTASPYEISSLSNLKWVSENASSWNATFKQTTDIDAAKTAQWNLGKGFSPIGKVDTSFTGTFNGQDHNITGLVIDRPGQVNVGLFGEVGPNGNIMKVHLKQLNIIGGSGAGGLAGINYGNIEGAEVSSTQGKIKGSAGATDIGGLVGYNSGTIKSSQASIDLSADSAHVGGLVGYNDENSIIQDSHASGKVIAKAEEVGGLVGYNKGSIDNSYATGDVENVGFTYAGGLAGMNYGPVKECYATGNVTGGGDDGGLIGDTHGPITHSHATGTIHADGHSNGGLAGYLDAPAKDCYATGDVLSTGKANTGGLVGYATANGSIEESFATGDVQTDNSNAGGLVGDTHGTVSNCYATGNSTGGNDVGGLIGYTTGTVESSYSTGKASAPGKNGGFIGSTKNAAVKDSYWDTESSGLSDAYGGTSAGGTTGLTSLLMQGAAASINMPGFDFTNVWQTQSGGYPILRNNQP